MSIRPSRRAAITRKNVIESDSDTSEVEETQPTPKRGNRRSTVGSRTSFDAEYTPRKPRQSMAKTPVTLKSKSNMNSAARVPLSEARRNRSQIETPKARKAVAEESVEEKVKDGYEAVLVMDKSQKENVSPVLLHKTTNIDMPPPPSLPVTTLRQPKQLDSIVLPPETANIAVAQHLEVPDGPKTRIVISKLVLENFKSYAGRQSIGPFHKCFSAVVGPNGSGKSNVIDSLLFVFGFRASKMRQGKISALIHNSANHPDLDFCSVEVHFETIFDTDDPNDYRIVDDKSIVISRKAYKNNSSKYTINGHDSSFTQVTTLLKDKGIDLDHKRFLILQGEVESIAQMRPKAANEHDDGLLEYLEDIIGTSKYKAPIEGALERMEALNGLCQEKISRVQLVEKEKSNLESRKNLAVQQILNENELASKQSMLYQLFIFECEANIRLTKDVIDELEVELKEGREAHKGNEDLIRKLENKHTNFMEKQATLKAMLADYTAQESKAEKENVSLQEKIKHLSNKHKKLTKSNAAAQHCLAESTLDFDNSENEILKFQNELARLGAFLREEEQELVKIRLALKDKTHTFSDQIESKQKLKQPWDAQIAEKRSALAIATAEFVMLEEQQSQIDSDLTQASLKLESLQNDGSAKSDEIKLIEAQVQEMGTNLSKTSAAVAKLKLDESAAKAELVKVRDRADEARSNLSISKQKGDVLTGLMKLRESGRISGFHGRLGDLGTIDEKYDTAITTACPALNNMVVDSVEVGQQCIDHLRRNNLGRANFILLDKLSARDNSKVPTPENVPRLVDLVRSSDPRFLAAFRKVLGNTLVVENLEQANRIAFGRTRWRVVTVEGQLIELSGAMSGGGQRISRGGMSSKPATNDSGDSITKLEQTEQKVSLALGQIQMKIGEHDTEIDRLNVELPNLALHRSRLVIEVDVLQKQSKDLQKRVKELTMQRSKATIDTKRLKDAKSSISTYEKDLAHLSDETAVIDRDIRALQDKIMEIGGIKLRSQQSKVDGLKDQIEALQQRFEHSEYSRSKAEQETKKHSKSYDNGLAELSAVVFELEPLEKQLQNRVQNKIAEKEINETTWALDECATNIQEIKDQLNRELAEVNLFRARELELKNHLDDHKKRSQEDHKKLTHWNEKRSKLSIQELSDHFLTEGTPNFSLSELSEDEIQALEKAELKAEIAVLEEATASAKIESGILSEYLSRCEEYKERAQALQEAVSERDLARSTAEDLRRRRLTEFMTGFNIISLRLKEMYQMITMGGNAELELVDSLDPFSEGILFSVMPPKKSWKNISNLSGGEKTLSSLALVFALHHYKPTPLYVMDEIDAALDFRNVSIVANYIKDRTKNAQFIVISLRNNMFELAARLVGIYKTSNMTKSIAIENVDMPMPVRSQASTAKS